VSKATQVFIWDKIVHCGTRGRYGTQDRMQYIDIKKSEIVLAAPQKQKADPSIDEPAFYIFLASN